MMQEENPGQAAPLCHTIRLRVRHSDIDVLGHVNSANYVHFALEAAYQHAGAAGFPLERWRRLGGAFVVRRHEIEYLRPAFAGDELLVTTKITFMRGFRATRRTTIVDAASGRLVATATSDYVWVNSRGKPARIPPEALAAFPVAAEQP